MPTEYITDDEAVAYGVATTRGTTAQRNAARYAVSSLMDSYFRARYGLPLTSWDESVKAAAGALYARQLLRVIGWNPESLADRAIMDAGDKAERWCQRVSTRDAHPLVGETAPAAEPAPEALSDDPREW
jgi:hypothetical protein